MSERVLEIPQSVIAEIWTHGLEEYPHECCGLLAGRSNRVERLFRVRNSLRSPTRFLMDSRDQYKAFKEIERAGLELHVIYHSHTMSPPYPSGTDLELAVYPDINYLLVSFERIRPHPRDPFPETQLYWIRDRQIHSARAEIV